MASELECQYKVSSEMSDRRIQKQVREMSRREVASSVSWYRLVLKNEETVLLLGRLGLWEVSWRPRTFTSSRKRELEGFGAVVDPKWSVRSLLGGPPHMSPGLESERTVVPVCLQWPCSLWKTTS